MTFDLSPFVFEFNGYGIRYYSLFYLLGFLAFYLWLRWKSTLSKEHLENFLFGGFLAVILGARLGYTFFYAPTWIWQNPFQILKIWEGGMSFHGGLLGVILFTMYFCKKHHLQLLSFFDLLAVPAIFSSAMGRIGNFLNGELWGNITDLPWCFYVPSLEGCRHPSQLYQTITDLLVFTILLFLMRFHPKTGVLSSVFLIGYSLSRSTNEIFFREPSWIFFGVTAGTWLSIPMLISGLLLLRYSSKA